LNESLNRFELGVAWCLSGQRRPKRCGLQKHTLIAWIGSPTPHVGHFDDARREPIGEIDVGFYSIGLAGPVTPSQASACSGPLLRSHGEPSAAGGARLWDSGPARFPVVLEHRCCAEHARTDIEFGRHMPVSEWRAVRSARHHTSPSTTPTGEPSGSCSSRRDGRLQRLRVRLLRRFLVCCVDLASHRHNRNRHHGVGFVPAPRPVGGRHPTER